LIEIAVGADDKKTLIDPTLETHRKLIDELCFSFVCKSPPFKIIDNASIGKIRDAKVIIQNVLAGAKSMSQLNQKEQNSGQESRGRMEIMLEIPFGRNHAVDFAAPVERGKRDWVGCFPVLTGNETEEEKRNMSLLACDVHSDVFVEKKKLFLLDHVAIARRDEWQQVGHEGFLEGSLCFPKKKTGVKQFVVDRTLGEEDLNKFQIGIYEYRYYRMKGDLLLLLEYAQNLVDVEDFGAANLFYKQALDLAPKHEEVTCAYARFLFRLTSKMKVIVGNKLYKSGVKEYKLRADKILKRGLETNPNHVPSLLTRSEIALSNKKAKQKAAKYAEQVLKLDPYNVNALCLFAESAVAAKRLPIADKYFRNALSLNSRDMDLLIGYGILNVRAGDYEKAEGLFSRALLLYPDNPVLLGSYFDNVLSKTLAVDALLHGKTTCDHILLNTRLTHIFKWSKSS